MRRATVRGRCPYSGSGGPFFSPLHTPAPTISRQLALCSTLWSLVPRRTVTSNHCTWILQVLSKLRTGFTALRSCVWPWQRGRGDAFKWTPEMTGLTREREEGGPLLTHPAQLLSQPVRGDLDDRSCFALQPWQAWDCPPPWSPELAGAPVPVQCCCSRLISACSPLSVLACSR